MHAKLEQIGRLLDVGGDLNLIFGFEADDPEPFVLTLMADYVAQATGMGQSATLSELERYASEHAEELRAFVTREIGRGRTRLILGTLP